VAPQLLRENSAAFPRSPLDANIGIQRKRFSETLQNLAQLLTCR